MSNSKSITLATHIKKRDAILAQNLDEDVVMANIDNGHYYGVDKTSKRIWELLETSTTCQAICDALSAEYEVEPAVCERDVLAFVQELVSEGLIETAGEW
jgi:hypothetical protein